MSLFVIVVIMALVFDFINGFHDAANSIATVVSTKVLTPLLAVLWAAGFNFLAFWVFKLQVADTVSKTVETHAITLEVILCGVIAAIIWNLFTWWRGIPSSSSHTLIGGFAGAAIAHAGWEVVRMDKVSPVLAFILLAPVIGMLTSYFISILMLHMFKRSSPARVNRLFRVMQLFSSASFSLGHGGNDAQKVMGIIGAAMIVNGTITDIRHLPAWVEIACYSSIAFGTLFGGWRIVKTMGSKITKLTPFEGFAAEAAGSVLLFGTSALGIPVSTTHTITGSIIGVGITKRVSAVRWGVTIDLIWAWVLTIPVSGILGAIVYHVLNWFSK